MYARLDPVRLLSEIRAAQQQLVEIADRPGVTNRSLSHPPHCKASGQNPVPTSGWLKHFCPQEEGRMARHPEPHIRRAIRVLAMVGELHKRGFQCLRAMPHWAPSGLYWRCSIGPAIFFHRNHGAILSSMATDVTGSERPQSEAIVAYYSSGQENRYFGWRDTEYDNASSLADKFTARFSILVRLGQGWDYAYAGWFQRLLGLAEAHWLPAVLSDTSPVSYDRVPLIDVRPMKHKDKVSTEAAEPVLPLPPPGLLQHDYGS